MNGAAIFGQGGSKDQVPFAARKEERGHKGKGLLERISEEQIKIYGPSNEPQLIDRSLAKLLQQSQIKLSKNKATIQSAVDQFIFRSS